MTVGTVAANSCRIEKMDSWVCHTHEEAFVSLEAAIVHWKAEHPDFPSVPVCWCGPKVSFVPDVQLERFPDSQSCVLCGRVV